MKNLTVSIAKVLLMAAVSCASHAFAGAANTVVECKDATGKIVLAGDVPGDIMDFELKAQAKDSQGRLVSANLRRDFTSENARLTIFDDLKNGVFAFKAESGQREGSKGISLYAIPKTIKAKFVNGEVHSKFKGKLSIEDANSSVNLAVSCKTDYAI